MNTRIENFLWRFIHKFNLSVTYKSKIGKKSPWVFIPYIPEACYRRDQAYLNGHQNRREMKQIVSLFNDFGFNVFVQNYTDTSLKLSTPPSIIFGLEPGFEAACKKWPNAIKIYYATGAYWKFQNGMTKKRTDEFNAKFGANYPYQRLVSETNRCEIADYIFQIGTKFTIETYPKHLQSKILIIRQSNTLVNPPAINKDFSNKKDFLWLGSSGTILKGLDLTIEYFKVHPNLQLHVVGHVDESFKKILETSACSNIHFYGFLNTSSELFIEIASKCNFLIYPSCSEGCPGAVINSMLYGIIPIVTKWAAIDNINSLGFMLKDFTIDAIDDAVNWTSDLTSKQIELFSQTCKQYVLRNYSLTQFRNDMDKALKSIINIDKNAKHQS